MPPAKRRKISPASKAQDGTIQEDGAGALAQSELKEPSGEEKLPGAGPSAAPATEAYSADKNKERQERFKALQARAVS